MGKKFSKLAKIAGLFAIPLLPLVSSGQSTDSLNSQNPDGEKKVELSGNASASYFKEYVPFGFQGISEGPMSKLSASANASFEKSNLNFGSYSIQDHGKRPVLSNGNSKHRAIGSSEAGAFTSYTIPIDDSISSSLTGGFLYADISNAGKYIFPSLTYSQGLPGGFRGSVSTGMFENVSGQGLDPKGFNPGYFLKFGLSKGTNLADIIGNDKSEIAENLSIEGSAGANLFKDFFGVSGFGSLQGKLKASYDIGKNVDLYGSIRQQGLGVNGEHTNWKFGMNYSFE